VPLKTENLSFALGGEVVDKVFVHVGDTVEEGRLLAQLELNGLDEGIAQAEINIEEYRLRLTVLEQQGKVRRTHGGVVLRQTAEKEIPLIPSLILSLKSGILYAVKFP